MKIRIKFSKSGVMKFVGHLDIMRYFQKAMRRADIDIAYSSGFSPHQIMSFAAPLGVGITSDGEYLDIEVHTTKSSKESIERLNQVSVDGIAVTSYRKLKDSSKAAMALVAAADYSITFRESIEVQNWQNLFFDFYAQPSIWITKKTKKSEKEMDIKPLIYDLQIEEKEITMRLSTGSVDNLKPELVMEAFYLSLGLELPKFAFQIHRREIYANLAELSQSSNQKTENTNPIFVALEDLGEDIAE